MSGLAVRPTAPNEVDNGGAIDEVARVVSDVRTLS